MDVRRLELLRELAERGSITAVAEATHRTPSAVSQQLKTLEREAGIPLTYRKGRGIALTTAGRQLARTATDLATAIAVAERHWDEFREAPRGLVRLLTFPTAGIMLLPGALSELQHTPGLEVVCTDLDDSASDYAVHTADHHIVLADSSGPPPTWSERNLVVEQLLHEPLDIALPVGHPLTRRARLRSADVIGEDWIGVPHGFPYDAVLRQIETVTGQRARVVQRFADNGIVEATVAAGLGIGVLPRYTTDTVHSGIVTRELVDVHAQRVISALMRPDRAVRPSVQLVLDALRRQGAEVQSRWESPDD